LDRLAAIISDQEIELPVIAGDVGKRLRFFLPFQPLLSRPAVGVCLFLPVGPCTLHQHQLLRLLVGRRRQQHALNQTEHRRGDPYTQRQGEDRNQAKAGLFQKHPNRKSEVSFHLFPTSLL
jgi:hypothetical protein